MAFNKYSKRKARATHQCTGCKKAIEVGETYHDGIFKRGREKKSEHQKLCSFCHRLFTTHKDGPVPAWWIEGTSKRRAFISRPKAVGLGMRTFVAREKNGNYPSLLIRTDSPKKATAIAYAEYEGDVPYPDIRVKREPRADASPHKEGVIYDVALMRNLGWYPFDECPSDCAECGLFEWEGYLPSYIDDETGLCRECRSKK